MLMVTNFKELCNMMKLLSIQDVLNFNQKCLQALLAGFHVFCRDTGSEEHQLCERDFYFIKTIAKPTHLQHIHTNICQDDFHQEDFMLADLNEDAEMQICNNQYASCSYSGKESQQT